MLHITIIIPRYGKMFTVTPATLFLFFLVFAALLAAGFYAMSGKKTNAIPLQVSANASDEKALSILAAKIGALSAKVESVEQRSARLGKEVGLDFQPHRDSLGLGGPLIKAQTPTQEDLNALLSGMESRLATKAEELSWIEDYLMAQKALKGMKPWRMPMEKFELSSGFGRRIDPFTGKTAFHPGLDFSTRYGNAVLASAHGTVIKSGYENGYGLSVVLKHKDGLATRYAHLSKVFVQPGEIVKAGQKIGAAGNTGRSTGTHLHFEVLHHDHPIDPKRFLFSEK